KDLGNLGEGAFAVAADINDSGQVVGTYATSLGPRAFLWTSSTGMIDLNSRIPSGSGMVLTSALGINERGQIVAIGTPHSSASHRVELDDPHLAGVSIHVFVLTPI